MRTPQRMNTAGTRAVAIAGTLGARDALIRWPEARDTFAGFFGQDTLLGRAMARWEGYGHVHIAPDLSHSPIEVEAIRGYRLDPDAASDSSRGAREADLRFRIAPTRSAAKTDERVVERISDPWGVTWGVVIGAKGRNP